VHSLRDKTVGEEAVQEGAVAQAQEKARLAAPGKAVFAAGQGGLNPGLEKTRVFYIKKPAQWFFLFFVFLFVFFCVFWGFGFLVFWVFWVFGFFFTYLPRRKSFWGFPVSRILLGASRL
jgi:hypothetical protein